MTQSICCRTVRWSGSGRFSKLARFTSFAAIMCNAKWPARKSINEWVTGIGASCQLTAKVHTQAKVYTERSIMAVRVFQLCFISMLVLAFIGAGAMATENSPSMTPRAALGKLATGPNYTIGNPVRSDGFLRIFTVNSRYGRFTISGQQRLIARLRELAALSVLEQKSKSEAFGKALGRAATSPVRLAGDVIKNPVGAVGNTISGVGNLFGRIASGVTNPGADPDSLPASLIGVSGAKRKLAYNLNVDPYTTFRPLAKALDDMATATALGGLAVTVGYAAVPGTAGLLLSRTTTANNVKNLVRDKTPAQLQDINRDRLRGMGVGRKTSRRFLSHKLYTPTDKTAVTAALHGMSGIKNRRLFIERAVNANTLDLAYFLRRRAEMLARYQRSTGSLASFVLVRGFPLNQLRDGRILALVPLDELAWTKKAAGAFSAITEELRRLKVAPGAELHISGRATPMARKMLQSMGWTVVENVAP